MNYVQGVVAASILSGSMLLMVEPLSNAINKSLDNAIKLTAGQVEDVAQLHYFSKDNAIKYSAYGYPSSKDGGIDKVIKSIGYTNHYDHHLNARVFLFNSSNTNDCYFNYDDVTGTTVVLGECKITNEMNKKLTESFEHELNL